MQKRLGVLLGSVVGAAAIHAVFVACGVTNSVLDSGVGDAQAQDAQVQDVPSDTPTTPPAPRPRFLALACDQTAVRTLTFNGAAPEQRYTSTYARGTVPGWSESAPPRLQVLGCGYAQRDTSQGPKPSNPGIFEIGASPQPNCVPIPYYVGADGTLVAQCQVTINDSMPVDSSVSRVVVRIDE